MNIPTSCVIETQGLTKTYKGIQALKALDLKVARNSICGFLGPNGAGKTTTIKLATGPGATNCWQRTGVWHGYREGKR